MVKISACVITKNEEKNITRWLTGMKELADERIVVDTGSSDQTVALAETAGARVVSFPWCDDFSAAKNFALEQAHGEWILFLDADEYFSARSVSRVKQHIQQVHPQRKVLGLACRLLNIDQDNHDMVVDSAVQVRIFRNLRSLRYQGKIHEALQYCAGEKKLQFQFLPDVEIYHTGYSSSIVREKLRRNMQLLEQKITRQGGEKPEDYHYLMDCYFGLGEYEKAACYARKSIETKICFIGLEGREYLTLVKCMIFLEEPWENILSAAEQAIEKYPNMADFFFLKAFVFWKQQDYLSVQEAAERGIVLWKQQGTSPQIGQTGSGNRLAARGYFYLGKLQQLQFKGEQAFSFFLAGLDLLPHDVELFAAMYECIAELPSVDIIQFLNSRYDKEQDASFLTGALERMNAGAVCLYYKKRSKKEDTINRVEEYRTAGRYDAAAVQLSDEIDWISRLAVWSAVEQGMFPEQAALSLLLPENRLKEWRHRLGVQETGKVSSEEKIREAAALFSAGRTSAGIDLLKTAWKMDKDDAILTYGLATLQQLAGQREAARTVLLQGSASLEEARALWEELQQDAEYPLVSILIPTYNRPELFEQTLKSACAQTYTNLEILVCDNSTNDFTERLMEKYVQNLRVKYYRNKAAKTKAENFQPFEQMAKGEYLQWLMDDDILHPEKIAKMIKCFQQNPQVTLVTSERGAIDAEGRVLPKPYIGFVDIQGEYRIYSGALICRLLLQNRANFVGEPSAVLFRRTQLRHPYWRAECRGYQTISDVVMWLELLRQGDCAFFKEALSYYRRHDGQEGSQPDTILLSRMEWNRLLCEQYAQGNLTEDDYFQGRLALCKEQAAFLKAGLDKLASREAWQRYQDCMREIGELSFE